MATKSLEDVWKDIKAHPYVASGILFIVGAVIVWFYFSGKPSGGQQGQSQNGTLQTLNAGALNAEALNNQAANQRAVIASRAQVSANQVNGAVQLGTIGAGVQTHAIDAAQTLGLARYGVIDRADAAKAALGLQYFDFLNNTTSNGYQYINKRLDDAFALLNRPPSSPLPGPAAPAAAPASVANGTGPVAALPALDPADAAQLGSGNNFIIPYWNINDNGQLVPNLNSAFVPSTQSGGAQ